VSSWKKFRDKTYTRMLAGEISVEQARARINGERARRGKPPLKPAGAAGAKSAGPPLREVWESNSDPLTRERAWDAMVQKSAAGTAPAPVRPASLWTGVDLGLLRDYEQHPDPARREAAREALVERGMLPGVPTPRGDRQVPVTLSPEIRGHLQLPGGWTV
jgi:hypothetical protein